MRTDSAQSRGLIRLLWPARLQLAASTAARVLAGLLVVAQAVAVGLLVSRLVLEPGADLRGPALWVVVTLAGRAVASYAADAWAAAAATRVADGLRHDLIARVLDDPDAMTGRSVGAMTTLTTRGVGAVEPYVTRYLPALVTAAFLPVATLVALALLDPWSALIVAATLPLVPIFGALVGLATRDRARRQWHELAGLSGHFLDVMRGLPTLVAHRRAEAQSASIRRITERYRRDSMETLRVAFASSAVLETVATISVALVAVCVGLRLAGGSLDLQTALTVLLLAPEAYWPLRRVGAEFHAAAEGTAAFTAAAQVLAPGRSVSSAMPVSGPAPEPASSAPPTICFRDVSHTYPGAGRPALVAVTAAAPGGRLTALVGPSGSGKTTLLSCVLGEVAYAGQILLDGHDLARLAPTRRRALIAQTAQQPWLLAGSITENLRVGRSQASREELWAALERVRLAEVVRRLPEGIETVLGEDGAGLSAGQRARLSLARVIVAGRPVVLLDEPTAHLDPETEAVLITTMRWLARRCTVLVVAHSAAVVAAADHVIEVPEPAGRREAARVAVVPSRAAPRVDEETPSAGRRFPAALGPALAALSAISGVALTATAGWLIARAAAHPPVLFLMVAIVGVRLFGLARPVFGYAERLVSHDTALRALAARRAEVYDALVPLVPGRLGPRRADALTTLVDDADAEVDRRLRVRLPISTAVLVSLCVVAIIAPFSAVVAAVLAGYALLAGLPAWGLSRAAAGRAEAAYVNERGRLGLVVEETLSTSRQRRLWGHRGSALDRLAAVAGRLGHAERASARGSALARGWILLLTGAAVAGTALSAGELSPAMRALVTLLPLAIGEVLAPLADAGALSARVGAAQARLDDLLALTPAVVAPAVARAVSGPAHLVVDGVAAGWGEARALDGFSLDLPPGAHVGVVGASGSGKSTLAALVLRFLDPRSGSVRLGGTDLRELSFETVRGTVGLVDDDPHVFASSVWENLRLARPDASRADLCTALETAHLGAWLAGLPDGVDTLIGEGNVSVSGGERARLAVARVLLADPAVVVLDEPTAHLDTATATALAREVLSPRRGRSVLWLSHDEVGRDWLDAVMELPAGAEACRPQPARTASV